MNLSQVSTKQYIVQLSTSTLTTAATDSSHLSGHEDSVGLQWNGRGMTGILSSKTTNDDSLHMQEGSPSSTKGAEPKPASKIATPAGSARAKSENSPLGRSSHSRENSTDRAILLSEKLCHTSDSVEGTQSSVLDKHRDSERAESSKYGTAQSVACGGQSPVLDGPDDGAILLSDSIHSPLLQLSSAPGGPATGGWSKGTSAPWHSSSLLGEKQAQTQNEEGYIPSATEPAKSTCTRKSSAYEDATSESGLCFLQHRSIASKSSDTQSRRETDTNQDERIRSTPDSVPQLCSHAASDLSNASDESGSCGNAKDESLLLVNDLQWTPPNAPSASVKRLESSKTIESNSEAAQLVNDDGRSLSKQRSIQIEQERIFSEPQTGNRSLDTSARSKVALSHVLYVASTPTRVQQWNIDTSDAVTWLNPILSCSNLSSETPNMQQLEASKENGGLPSSKSMSFVEDNVRRVDAELAATHFINKSEELVGWKSASHSHEYQPTSSFCSVGQSRRKEDQPKSAAVTTYDDVLDSQDKAKSKKMKQSDSSVSQEEISVLLKTLSITKNLTDSENVTAWPSEVSGGSSISDTLCLATLSSSTGMNSSECFSISLQCSTQPKQPASGTKRAPTSRLQHGRAAMQSTILLNLPVNTKASTDCKSDKVPGSTTARQSSRHSAPMVDKAAHGRSANKARDKAKEQKPTAAARRSHHSVGCLQRPLRGSTAGAASRQSSSKVPMTPQQQKVKQPADCWQSSDEVSYLRDQFSDFEVAAASSVSTKRRSSPGAKSGGSESSARQSRRVPAPCAQRGIQFYNSGMKPNGSQAFAPQNRVKQAILPPSPPPPLRLPPTELTESHRGFITPMRHKLRRSWSQVATCRSSITDLDSIDVPWDQSGNRRRNSRLTSRRSSLAKIAARDSVVRSHT